MPGISSAPVAWQQRGHLTVVTQGGLTNPTTLLTKQQRGAAFISSYDEEKPVVRLVHYLLLPSHEDAVICTDSQLVLR